MFWSTNPPTYFDHRALIIIIFREHCSSTANVKRNTMQRRLTLEQFLTPDQQKIIILHTYAYAQSLIEREGESSWLGCGWNLLSRSALMLFIDILLLIGIHRSVHENNEQKYGVKNVTDLVPL